MTSMSESFNYSKSEKEKITNALKKYEKMNQEDFSAETIYFWIEEFSKLHLPLDEVLHMIEETSNKEVYGKTQFRDFLNEDSTYIDHDEVNRLAYKRFLQALKNMGMTYEDYENKCLEITRERLEKADKKLLELSKEQRLLQVNNLKEK